MACYKTTRHAVAFGRARFLSAGLCTACIVLSIMGEAFGDTSSGSIVTPGSNVDFASQIQPLIAAKCVRCHGPQTTKAGLRLDDRSSALGKLESGNRAIVPGRPADSEIL